MQYTTGRKTESVGTAISEVFPPSGTRIPVLKGVSVTTGGAEQTLYVCAPIGLVENTNRILASGTSTEVTNIEPLQYSDGTRKTINAGSLIAVTTVHGTYEVLEVLSVSGSTITFASSPSQDVPARSIMYVYYDPTEESIGPPPAPTTLHPFIVFPANATTIFTNVNLQAGVSRYGGAFAFGQGTPLLLYLTNDTSQAVLNWARCEYIDRSKELIFALYGADAAAADGLPRPQPIDLPTLP